MRLSDIQQRLRGYDALLSIVVFILTSIGLAAIYSVDLSRGDSLIYFPTQVIAFFLGFGVFTVCAFWHQSRFKSIAHMTYIFGLILLVGVLIFGTTIRGTTGWFRFAGVSFQPAEFAKVALILLMGWWMSKQHRRFESWEFVVSSALATGFYVGLIFLQPDLGSAVVLSGIWFGLLVVSGVRKRYIFGFILAGIIAAMLGWMFLFAPYQKERVLTFLDPGRDPLGSGYNVTQSVIAIGSGQFWGKGLGFGSQSQLHFLPEAQTDFIIAVIGEELGFFGISVVLLLYALLIWRLSVIAMRSNDDFGTYTAFGVALLFSVQMVINIGGATGLLPVTGVPLPFLSYGGSSLIMNYLLLGVAASIARSNAHHKLHMERKGWMLG